MISSKKKAIQSALYFGGLLIMTLGVAISVKSGLGVTPISSVPYTMSIVLGMELGLATAVFSIIAALLEIPILRKDYKITNLLQIPVSIIFGFFMSACTRLVQTLPTVDAFPVRFILTLLSTVVVSVGVFAYVSSGFVPLPTEGILIAIAQKTSLKFSTLKLIGDISMVSVSLTVCWIVLSQWGSIGLGTVVAALLTGNEVKLLTKKFGPRIKKLLA